MNTTRKYIEKTYTISTDVLLDILRIVLKNELPNSIDGINLRESTIRLNVKFPVDMLNIKQIKENLEELLTDFDFFANESQKDFGKFKNMREDDWRD